MVVPGVVCTRAAYVGNRATKGIDVEIIPARLAVRHSILFRHLLVADLRPDSLRRFSVAAGVSAHIYRLPDLGAVSSDLYDTTLDPDPTIWKFGIPRRAVCLGVH